MGRLEKHYYMLNTMYKMFVYMFEVMDLRCNPNCIHLSKRAFIGRSEEFKKGLEMMSNPIYEFDKNHISEYQMIYNTYFKDTSAYFIDDDENGPDHLVKLYKPDYFFSANIQVCYTSVIQAMNSYEEKVETLIKDKAKITPKSEMKPIYTHYNYYRSAVEAIKEIIRYARVNKSYGDSMYSTFDEADRNYMFCCEGEKYKWICDDEDADKYFFTRRRDEGSKHQDGFIDPAIERNREIRIKEKQEKYKEEYKKEEKDNISSIFSFIRGNFGYISLILILALLIGGVVLYFTTSAFDVISEFFMGISNKIDFFHDGMSWVSKFQDWWESFSDKHGFLSLILSVVFILLIVIIFIADVLWTILGAVIVIILKILSIILGMFIVYILPFLLPIGFIILCIKLLKNR